MALARNVRDQLTWVSYDVNLMFGLKSSKSAEKINESLNFNL